jgi:ubiquinol-cytochrome c reductase cytochrome c1 subunit
MNVGRLNWAGKFALILLSWLCCVDAGAATETMIRMEKIHIDIHDVAAIKRGAHFFKRNCMSCHSMKYLRYDKLSQQQGVVFENMPKHTADSWQGHPPPDLSLAARVHRPEWLYTYLQSFYVDNKRAIGSNNLAYPGSAMPNPFMHMQGRQVLRTDWKDLKVRSSKPQWFELLKLEKPGTMSSAAFHAHMGDLVHYFVYAADPHRLEREHLGYKVLGFLLVFFVFAVALKQSYWQDIKKSKHV